MCIIMIWVVFNVVYDEKIEKKLKPITNYLKAGTNQLE